jgi:hypothetical protein
MIGFFVKKKIPLSHSERQQILKKEFLQCAVTLGKKKIHRNDLADADWPNMDFVFDGETVGHLERVIFAPPFLVVGHIATVPGKVRMGYGGSIAEGLKRLASSLQVEQIIFSESMQGHGHPAFFQKIGAIALPLNALNQQSSDYLWKISSKDEVSRNPGVSVMNAAQRNAILANDKLIMSLLRRSSSSDLVDQAIADLKAQKKAIFPLSNPTSIDVVTRIDLAILALKKFR